MYVHVQIEWPGYMNLIYLHYNIYVMQSMCIYEQFLLYHFLNIHMTLTSDVYT